MPQPLPTFIDIPNAQCYLVGGAVRDRLLGIDSKDKDWLVVGSDAEAMIARGFKQVGKDFPVFLHPHSQEEYALARTERKTGHGYTGFEFTFSKHTSLEQDLSRRDLSINAIAMDKNGTLIDPFNGQADIENKVLRHVSSAFIEDPLRVLRCARFAAQLANFGFELHPDTEQLIHHIVDSNELQFLQPERIWQETARALQCDRPDIFISVLHQTSALKAIYPELEKLFGVPQNPKYHPEIDSGIHTLMVMQQSALLSDKLSVRFAAMSHDFGKGTTNTNELPQHIGHEQRSYEILQQFYQRIPVPKHCRELADKVAKFHLHTHRAFELRAKTILNLFKQLDAFRKPELLNDFLLSCLADSRGRTGFENKDFPEIDYLRRCYQSACDINTRYVHQQSPDGTPPPQGQALGQMIDHLRVENISKIKKQWHQNYA